MKAEIQGNQVRGHLETMILSVLEKEGAHGFEVVKRLQLRGAGVLQLKEGTVYPVLYRLEQQGLVKAHWEAENSGRRGPRRRIYELTTSGHRQLVASREDWESFVSVVGAIISGSET